MGRREDGARAALEGQLLTSDTQGLVTRAEDNGYIFPENKERLVKQRNDEGPRYGNGNANALTYSLNFVLKWCSWPHKYAQSFGCQIKMENRRVERNRVCLDT